MNQNDQTLEDTPSSEDDVIFSCTFPQQTYSTKSKHQCFPFNKETSNNGKFLTLNDAMIYIKNHILSHGSKFSRQLAKIYISYCSIYDPYLDSYISLEDINKKEFEAAYQLARNK